jgi:hypothetical protein
MNSKIVEDMSVFERARWHALIEAINIIGDACDEKGKNFNKMKISPLDLVKYIEGTCDKFAGKIEEEIREESEKKKFNSINNLTINLPTGSSITYKEV